MNKVVITGANGFLGRNLTKYLSNKGIKVFAIVRNENSNIESLKNLKNVEILYCESKYIENLEYKLPKDIDVIYHFAWEGIYDDRKGNYEIQLKNVEASAKFIEIAIKLNIKKFIFADSLRSNECLIYLKENILPININTIYGLSKITSNSMNKIIASNSKLEYISTIISNVYGGDEKSSSLICSMMPKMLNNEDVAFTLGEQIYDFIYIDDAIEMFYLIGKNGKPFKEYYIGNSTQHPLKEYLLELKEVTGYKKSLNLGKIPFNGASVDYSQINKNSIFEDFNFIPKVSFKEGIKKTIMYYTSNK
ncbi:hypothetical protein AN641_08310 [Candidatus Epulonipiscioides gigas]|nr:hypothetical protein AN641_08310 [Epulopiscium sp. SCG-C07WGA-EpuloA2]